MYDKTFWKKHWHFRKYISVNRSENSNTIAKKYKKPNKNKVAFQKQNQEHTTACHAQITRRGRKYHKLFFAFLFLYLTTLNKKKKHCLYHPYSLFTLPESWIEYTSLLQHSPAGICLLTCFTQWPVHLWDIYFI